jgi:hypothetical protein
VIPDLGKTVCAIIEFEQADTARFAVQALKMRTKAYGFRLALLEAGVSIILPFRQSVLLLKTCHCLTGNFDMSLFSAFAIRLMDA